MGEQNQRLDQFVETSAGGEHVRTFVLASLPPVPPLELTQLMAVDGICDRADSLMVVPYRNGAAP